MIEVHLNHDVDLTEIPGGFLMHCRDCSLTVQYTEIESERALVVLFGPPFGLPAESIGPEPAKDRYLEPYRKQFGERL